MGTEKIKIFIVDDEPLLLEMLVDYLLSRDDNLTIHTYPTGEKCLAHIKENPDLVILDYYLNSRESEAADGIDILKLIKSMNKALPVIMLSSQKSFATAANTIKYGAIHYVRKGKEAFDEIYELIKSNT